ncbi:MAG TPA: hypothetical protein VK501_14835 [Baekduia sp.]|uniref:hypothetical protein n=1 Tax=Baekduia sp. TaxID=2600305 RepID=UPI002BBF469E|nr:hypothetical protein [Baekduia sp.]HMJ35184.1 hypothetical protein [Baekduia sp.]
MPVVTIHRADDRAWVVAIDTTTVPDDHLKDGAPDLRVWCNDALVMVGSRFQDYSNIAP